jgi:basic membrane lipoprotein Med (substrate-binding protein (PBP1-ABC) superfamily)
MNYLLRTRLAPFVGVVLALFAGSAVAAGLAQTAESDRPQVAIVIAGDAAEQPDIVVAAEAAAARSGAQLRVPHTTADQLGVTHLLAARGYDVIVTVGVDHRIAIAPVAEHYPGVRFVESAPDALSTALAQ